MLSATRLWELPRYFVTEENIAFLTTFVSMRNYGSPLSTKYDSKTDSVWNVMAHVQKPDFVFRRNGRVHLNRRGASVQPINGSRSVHISGSNTGYTMFRGSVKSTGYPLHSPDSLSLPLPGSPCAITVQLDSDMYVCVYIYIYIYIHTYIIVVCNWKMSFKPIQPQPSLMQLLFSEPVTPFNTSIMASESNIFSNPENSDTSK